MNRRKINKIKKNNRNTKRQLRTQRRRNIRNTRQIRRLKKTVKNIRRDIPNAYVKNFRNKYFRITKTTQDTMIVSGRDLVYKIPNQKLEQEMRNVLTVIPANPAYWQGTGIASMAVAYQQYRPIKFNVHYIPIVDTSRSGTIFAGTIWNTPINDDGFEQTLTRTPGAINTQFFKPATGRVKVRGMMNNKLFNVSGEMNEDSNPFYYVAVCTGSFDNKLDPPGMFYVTYTYVFKNPIGNNTTFRTPALINFGDIKYQLNTTALLCKSTTIVKRIGNTNQMMKIKLPLFTQLQIDWSELGGPVASYNDDPIPLEEEDKVWVFQNWTNDTQIETGELPKQYRLQFATHADQMEEQASILVAPGDGLILANNRRNGVDYIIALEQTKYATRNVMRDSEENLVAYRIRPDEYSQLDGLRTSSIHRYDTMVMVSYVVDKYQDIYMNGIPIYFEDEEEQHNRIIPPKQEEPKQLKQNNLIAPKMKNEIESPIIDPLDKFIHHALDLLDKNDPEYKNKLAYVNYISEVGIDDPIQIPDVPFVNYHYDTDYIKLCDTMGIDPDLPPVDCYAIQKDIKIANALKQAH